MLYYICAEGTGVHNICVSLSIYVLEGVKTFVGYIETRVDSVGFPSTS